MGHGGARPGAGRPRKNPAPPPPAPEPSNVIPFGPRPTLGDVLQALRPAAPAVDSMPSGGISPEATPAPAPLTGSAEPAAAPPPLVSVPAPAETPLPAPGVRGEATGDPPERANRMFARMAAQAATSIAVISFGKIIAREGLEPQTPGDDDIEAAEKATEEGISIAVGDAAIPWWAGMALAYGNLYVTMRMGAKPPERAEKVIPDGGEPPAELERPAPPPPGSIPPERPAAPRPAVSPGGRRGPVPFSPLPRPAA